MNKFYFIASLFFYTAVSEGQTVGELVLLRESGPRDRRLNLVIVGDGYTSGQKAKFVQDAGVFEKGILDAMPFLAYRNYINTYAIFVVSPQAGADIPNNNNYVDTYFDATYGSGGIDRLLTMNSSRARQVIFSHVPEANMMAGVVNHSKYGGSGGSIAVANYTTPEIVAHEMGHSFASLADEYDYAGGSPREAVNATAETQRNLIKWNYWILSSTPVPTPETSTYNTAVGLFEGAVYSPKGWYRPWNNCLMRNNGRPLCPICTEAYVLGIYNRVSPIDSVFPINTGLVILSAGMGLRVRPMQPTTHVLETRWYVDGIFQSGASSNTFIPTLADGNYQVRAVVTDTTAFVRRDPSILMKDTASWDVRIQAGLTVHPTFTQKNIRMGAVEKGKISLLLPEFGEYHLLLSNTRGKIILDVNFQGIRGRNEIKSGISESGIYFFRLTFQRVPISGRLLFHYP